MIGTQISHYSVEALLGSGGMGMVYRARDTRLGRLVALKVLKSELTNDPDRRRRFLQEARSASSLTHPAIAQVYDVGEFDNVTYMAMEFVEGQTVRQLIAARELDLLAAIEIALQVAGGLARAHGSGLVHRDIKSDNIMVNLDGIAKILDFGLAKLLESEAFSGGENQSQLETMAQTQIGTVLGTAAYMSPEQARGRTVDHRSDLFSLGIVLYEMVTSELPFQGHSPLDTMHAVAFEEVRPVTIVRKNLPVDLQRIISRCLRKRPEDRYPGAEALQEDLRALKNRVESGSEPVLSTSRRLHQLTDWVRYSLPVGWGALAATGGVALALGYLIFRSWDFGSLILLLLIGLPTYRYVRNRRARMLKHFVNKVSKVPEVDLITARNNQITIVVRRAKATFYLYVNSLLEKANQKQFYGEPLEATIRDDLKLNELNQLLRDPGVLYVHDELLNRLQEVSTANGSSEAV